MTPFARNILIAIILILGIGGYFIFSNKNTDNNPATVTPDGEVIIDINKNPGLKVCPEEMIVNEMPGIDRSGESDTDAPSRSSYYILKRERHEVDEFNTAWVAENCRVPVTSAH